MAECTENGTQNYEKAVINRATKELNFTPTDL